jgi:hypothetical protein
MLVATRNSRFVATASACIFIVVRLISSPARHGVIRRQSPGPEAPVQVLTPVRSRRQHCQYHQHHRGHQRRLLTFLMPAFRNWLLWTGQPPAPPSLPILHLRPPPQQPEAPVCRKSSRPFLLTPRWLICCLSIQVASLRGWTYLITHVPTNARSRVDVLLRSC